jgi:hypothetical protein
MSQQSTRYWHADKLAPTLMVDTWGAVSDQPYVLFGDVDRPHVVTVQEAREIGQAMLDAAAAMTGERPC